MVGTRRTVKAAAIRRFGKKQFTKKHASDIDFVSYIYTIIDKLFINANCFTKTAKGLLWEKKV